MSLLFPLRKQLLRFTLLAPPLVGGAIGFALVAIYPPRNPVDYWPATGSLSLGFAVVGLLLGFLTWLWMRGRVSALIAFSAIAIPFCSFGWFVNGKGGRWDVAWWFGLFGIITTVTFFIRSFALVGNDGERDRGV